MIYLIRHGETVWNSERRMQGQADSPLTPRGLEQVRANAATLAREIDDPGRFALVASPLGRAWQSAVIVAGGLGLDPRRIAFDDRLKEHSFGTLEGRTMDEIEAGDPGFWARRAADHWNWQAPGGESYALLDRRVGAWLAEQTPGADLIVVCHGMVSRVLRGRYAGLAREETLVLSESQDALWRLDGGRIETLVAGGG